MNRDFYGDTNYKVSAKRIGDVLIRLGFTPHKKNFNEHRDYRLVHLTCRRGYLISQSRMNEMFNLYHLNDEESDRSDKSDTIDVYIENPATN